MLGGIPMNLVYPVLEYKEAFSSYYLEYKTDILKHNHLYLDLYELGYSNYEAYIEKLSKQREGLNLPEGWAPSHTLFLVENEDIKGIIRIRMNLASEYIENFIGHIGYDIKASERRKGYGLEILRLGLGKAKEFGLKEVLVLCSDANLASRKIIEHCEGNFESTIIDPDGEVLRRYWISVE